jgi:MFS family permease
VGFTPQSFGIALTLASLPLIVGAPFWGKRSDVIGRKPVFIIGVTGAAAGTLLIALVLQLGVSGILTGFGLLVLFALAGSFLRLGASAIYPAATAYMVDVTDIQHRGQGLAIIGAPMAWARFSGRAGGCLAFFGPLVPMYVAAIGLGGVVMTWYLLPGRQCTPAPGKIKLKLGDRRLRPFLIVWFVFFLTFMAQLILSFYLQDDSASPTRRPGAQPA